VDKAKIRYGVVRITRSGFSFFAHTFLRLFAIVLVFLGVLYIPKLAAHVGFNLQWLDRKFHLFAAGIIAIVSSISVTQWLLLLLLLIVWNTNIVGRRTLDKLRDIESAVATKIRRE
jgi:hypothetical protein